MTVVFPEGLVQLTHYIIAFLMIFLVAINHLGGLLMKYYYYKRDSKYDINKNHRIIGHTLYVLAKI